jgi:hypothetical protein
MGQNQPTSWAGPVAGPLSPGCERCSQAQLWSAWRPSRTDVVDGEPVRWCHPDEEEVVATSLCNRGARGSPEAADGGCTFGGGNGGSEVALQMTGTAAAYTKELG